MGDATEMMRDLRIVLVVLIASLVATICGSSDCVDTHNRCYSWSLQGKCESAEDRAFMHSHCRVSCKIPPCHSGYSRTKTQNSTKQCAADGCGKKSDNGKDDSLQVEFQHRLQGGDLHVEWVPHTGEAPVRIFTMQPGTSHSVNTFVGHVFRVIDADTNKE